MPINPLNQNRYIIYKIDSKVEPHINTHAPGYRNPVHGTNTSQQYGVNELRQLVAKANQYVSPYLSQSYVEGITNGMGVFALSNGLKVELFEYAVRSGAGKKAVEVGLKTELQFLGRTGVKYLGAARGANKIFGALAIPLVFADATQKGDWKNHHTADLLIAAGSIVLLTGPVGFAVGASFMIIDLGVKAYTKKSITENLFD